MLKEIAILLVVGTLGLSCRTDSQVALGRGGAVENITLLRYKAEAAWAKRGDRRELAKAVTTWEQVQATNPTNSEILMKLSRAYFIQGEHLRVEDQLEDALARFEKGVLAGEHGMMASSEAFAARIKAGDKVRDAVSSMPQSAYPVIYWYAVNLGRFAYHKGLSTILFYRERIFKLMTQVLDSDEGYFYGAPHRYFGAYFAKAPTFAGGNMHKAKEHFERAIALAPNCFETKVTYAEFFAIKQEDPELFDQLLQSVIAGDPTSIPGIEPEQRFEQYKAARLLEQKDQLF